MDLPVRMLYTEAEYLAYDLANEGKHEFVNGEIIAMAGVSEAHSTVVTNLLVALGVRVKGGPCRVHGADLRVRIDETGLYAYPDISVVCGQAEFAPTNPPTLVNPTVIVEVLSESTERYDRAAKLEHYRHRTSVQCVLLIESRRRWVNSYTRNPDGSWTLLDFTAGRIPIAALGVTLPVDDVYDGAVGTIGWVG